MREDVAVVVPVFRRRLERDEEIALRHLELVLASRPRFFVAPRGLSPRRPGFSVEHFAADRFTSIAAYSRLLLDPAFYRRFAAFCFVLIYQLDCLVFRDDLDRFTGLEVDYLGAPWLEDRADPERGYSRVGNGGFSLRRVDACLRVLDETRPRVGLATSLARVLARRREPRGLRRRWRVAREVSRGIGWYRRHYSLNEDHFWSDRAALFDPDFRVADVATGLRFAFDEAPRAGQARLGGLPMGAHGWHRRDRDFWTEHLLPEALAFDAPTALA